MTSLGSISDRIREPEILSLFENGHRQQAAEAVENRIEEARASGGPALFQALELRGDLAFCMADPVKATQAYEEALGVLPANSSRLEPSLRARVLGNLADLYDRLGREAEASEHFERAVELYLKVTPHPIEILATLKNNLGLLYKNSGNFDQSETCYIEAANYFDSLHGENSEEVADVLNNLGGLYAMAGFDEQAQSTYERALRVRQVLHAGGHTDVGQTQGNLAVFHANLGQEEQAQTYFVNALKTLKKHPGDGEELEIVVGNYQAWLESLGRDPQADAALAKARKALAALG
ncbi:MAG: tetratricopeptide repeat protein [Verrucomicrobiota bacterium]